MVRSFIAIDFPSGIVNEIDRITTCFKAQTPSRALKWVAPDNLHLTIKFLGDIPENHVDTVKALITETLKSQPPFEIALEGLGMYPNARRPRVVWLGITGAGPLSEMHQALEQALQAVEIQPENRPFSPHLTIARVRDNADPETVREIGETLSQFKVDSLGKLKIDTVQLYQSVLTPKGPLYTALLTLPLNQV